MADSFSIASLAASAVTGLVSAGVVVWLKPRFERSHKRELSMEVIRVLILDFRRHALESWRVLRAIEAEGLERLPLTSHVEKLKWRDGLISQDDLLVIDSTSGREAARLHSIAINYNIEVSRAVEACENDNHTEFAEYVQLLLGKTEYLVKKLDYPLSLPKTINWAGQPERDEEKPKIIHFKPRT